MKKLFFACIFSLAAVGSTFAGGYKLDEAALDVAFENATDVTMMADANLDVFAGAAAAENPTKQGYLLRAFFCGQFALHRSYMGTGGKSLFVVYFCTGGGCGIVTMVDFWGVIIKGDEFLAKYKDNPKFIVFGKDK